MVDGNQSWLLSSTGNITPFIISNIVDVEKIEATISILSCLDHPFEDIVRKVRVEKESIHGTIAF